MLLFAGEQVQEIFENSISEIVSGPNAVAYIDSYQAAIAKLDEYFASKTNITYERHLFRKLKQEAGEKMEKFGMRLKIQAKKCGFGEQTNDNVRDQLIEKCTSIEFRREMLKKKAPTMEDILRYAIAFEAVEEQAKTFKEPSASLVTASVNKILEVKACTRCGSVVSTLNAPVNNS